MAGSSAATAIAYVAKNGEKHTGWVPTWDNLHTFCKRAGLSMFAPSPLSLPSFSSLCSLPSD
ncbi:hypothetical protein AMTR_s00016p00177940 [Amborella trichopoda]|uniref:CASP-like protein n=1 Tax=Amborella trichopoda TaxID=13333 RepID=W1PF31_AMBTC|nr:hypothetical protein AMTR_s00016p00177940 [Amborella trichopoda]